MPQTTSTPHVVREFAGSEDGILLVIHAGAGNRGKHDSPERRARRSRTCAAPSKPDIRCSSKVRRRRMRSAPPSASWRMPPSSTPDAARP